MSSSLNLILDEIQSLRAEVGYLREETKSMESSIREDMKSMENSIRADMKTMEDTLRQEIRDGDNSIRVILENEIRPQIRVVAERHLDLNRKLDEIKKEMKKNELVPARLSLLEKDMRMVKQKLAMPV